MFAEGGGVILTAIPEEGYYFTGWTGCPAPGVGDNANQCTVNAGGASVTTNFSSDVEGAVIPSVVANPNPAAVGTSIVLTAIVDDTTTGGSTIASAAYTIDGGSPVDMSASDGVFDEVSEEVTATLPPLGAGVYEICVSGEDAAGNAGTPECLLVAVYDPAGGFVTGGGWIQSPAGAYVPNPSLSGKATFGFVSKYQKGATKPTGNTEFQFKAGNLNFHSDSYEWLVVAGAKAMYKGVGSINNTGNYGFLLSAIDGQIDGGGGIDKFRIKIWDKDNGDAIVYDNQYGSGDNEDPTTAIVGGSIIIHKSK
jgi:hypothetical protein